MPSSAREIPITLVEAVKIYYAAFSEEVHNVIVNILQPRWNAGSEDMLQTVMFDGTTETFSAKTYGEAKQFMEKMEPMVHECFEREHRAYIRKAYEARLEGHSRNVSV